MNKALFFAAAALLAASDASVAAETAPGAHTFITEEAPIQYLAKDRLIGTKVKGPDGKIIGDIEDIILSGDHQVVGVVMGTGGFFGLFEKKVGVEIGALQFEVTDGKIGATLPAYTKETLEAAPAFVRNQPKKSLFQRAVEKSQEIRDKTGASAKDAYEHAKEKAAPAIEKAKDAAKDALDNAGPAVQDAKEKMKEVIETAKEKAKEVVDKAKDAAKVAEHSATAPAPAPVGEAPAAKTAGGDDFLRIRGIDEALRDRLHTIDVKSFEQMSKWTDEDVVRVEKDLAISDRIAKENWREQAKILSEGGETAYSRERAKQQATSPAP